MNMMMNVMIMVDDDDDDDMMNDIRNELITVVVVWNELTTVVVVYNCNQVAGIWKKVRAYRRSIPLQLAYHYRSPRLFLNFHFPRNFYGGPHTRSERVKIFTFSLRHFASELQTETSQVQIASCKLPASTVQRSLASWS